MFIPCRRTLPKDLTLLGLMTSIYALLVSAERAMDASAHNAINLTLQHWNAASDGLRPLPRTQ